jgi:hypothetical protein
MLKRNIYDYKTSVIYAIYDWSWLYDYVVQKTMLYLPLVANVVVVLMTIYDYVFYDCNFYKYN